MADTSETMTYDVQTTGDVCATGYRLAALYQVVLQRQMNWDKADFEAAVAEIYRNPELSQRIDDVSQLLFEAVIEEQEQEISGWC